jgi:hypothetical protein
VLLFKSELSKAGLSGAELRGLDGRKGKLSICLLVVFVERLVVMLTVSVLESF